MTSLIVAVAPGNPPFHFSDDGGFRYRSTHPTLTTLTHATLAVFVRADGTFKCKKPSELIREFNVIVGIVIFPISFRLNITFIDAIVILYK